MIPVRLKLRNFMPYRDASLDFTGLHLAVITGDNGNGKSAIIDAMTWALWGKARVNNADELMYASQAVTDMEVEFDFSVGNNVYRVIRKRTRPKKRTGAGQSALDLLIENEGNFRVVTGGIMDETQDKINNEILHMDYDTFINSAFLRQGHADEFTMSKPADRKETLAKILGLGIYDSLEERAREEARACGAENAQFENTIAEINAELARRLDYTQELEKAETVLKEINAAARQKEEALNTLRGKKERLEQTRAQLNQLQEHISSKAADLRRWQEQGTQHQANLKKYEAVMGRQTEIEAGYASFIDIKKTVDEMDRKAMRSRGLDKQREALEKKIDQSRNELIRAHAVKKASIQELEKKTAALPELKSQLQKQQAANPALAGSDRQLVQFEEKARAAQAEASRLEAENALLEKEIAEAGEKLDLIQKHTATHTEAKCPLCEQELTREALELIRNKYTVEQQEKNNKLLSNRVTLTEKQSACNAAIKEKAALESRVNQAKTMARSQEEVLRSRIKEIEDSAVGLAELKEDADIIEAEMAGNRFAAVEQQALGEIIKELAALDYDAAKHEAARGRLKQAEAFDTAKRQLDEALRLNTQEKEAAARADEAAQNIRQTLEKDAGRKDSLSAEIAALPQVAQQLAEADAEYKTISGQRAQAQQAVGSVRARLDRLAELENRKKSYEDRIAAAAREESIYKELAQAFGKNGIQALIIDAARPEIEEEANRLLARLTDNRMSIKLETQRTTKKDTLKETLDIIVGDELGTRNYEMFSGGEAFRINFAIRIALSRLLARRAGAPLPTLIIDEGFGTQDANGMEKLKEAINSIQDDFDKILVITHMDDLKDAFPNRIDVTKTADGSVISVN